MHRALLVVIGSFSREYVLRIVYEGMGSAQLTNLGAHSLVGIVSGEMPGVSQLPNHVAPFTIVDNATVS